MTSQLHDVIIIGAGSGGLAALLRQLRDRYVSGVLQATRVSRSSRLGRCQCAAS